MKLGTLMYHDESSSEQKLQVLNNNKQPQAINTCKCAYKLLVVDPLTMELGTLMYHDESSLKQKLKAC